MALPMVGRQVDLTLLLLQLALKSSTTEGAAAAEEDEASPEQPEPPELRAVGVAAACLPGAVTTLTGVGLLVPPGQAAVVATKVPPRLPCCRPCCWPKLCLHLQPPEDYSLLCTASHLPLPPLLPPLWPLPSPPLLRPPSFHGQSSHPSG